MNNYPEVHSDVRKYSSHFFASMTRLRPGLENLMPHACRSSGSHSLGATALPAEGPSATLPGTTANSKSHEPSRLEKAYHERATRNPQDVEAFEGMAILQVRRGDYAKAIESYRHVLEFNPNDHDAKVGLGRALAFDAQYDAALREFQELLQEHPGDTDALEGMARVTGVGRPPDGGIAPLRKPGGAISSKPRIRRGPGPRGNESAPISRGAKDLDWRSLAAAPRNRDAQLQLAYLDLYEGHQRRLCGDSIASSAKTPRMRKPSKGNVRVAYYRGDLVYARNLAAKTR